VSKIRPLRFLDCNVEATVSEDVLPRITVPSPTTSIQLLHITHVANVKLQDNIMSDDVSLYEIFVSPFCETCWIKVSRLLRRVIDSMGKLDDNVNTDQS